MTSTSSEKAQVLAEFFSSVFCADEDSSSVPVLNPNYRGPLLEYPEFTPGVVEEKLKSLKPTSSPGPDGLHPKVLRELAVPLSVPLSALFRKSLDSGVVPSQWSVGEVVPIFKKGKKQDPSNYRPVSLTSVTSKVMESIVRDHLLEHLTATEQLTKAQHGFLPRHSCVTQLLATFEDWTRLLENGEPVDVAYLDFRKAFDSVPHLRLLSKLHGMGIRGHLLTWIESFLTGRRQRVVVDGVKSDWTRVTSGIPQGSVLGPTLFVAFINDMPASVRGSIQLFADDAKLYGGVGAPDGRELLQADLNALAEWSQKWLLPFNTAKCSTLHLGSGNPQDSYTILGVNLDQTSVEKDLGVLVDSQLKFRQQAALATSKANRILGLIRHSFAHLDKRSVPLLFRTLVRPHLEYANAIWGPFNKADIKLVERVQHRATRLIPSMRHLPYEQRLRALKLPSLQYRRRRGTMITMYNIMHGRTGLHKEDFVDSPRTDRTRGHAFKVAKKRAETRVRRNHLFVRAANDWNSLPDRIACAPSLNQFKNELDRFWADHVFAAPT